MGNSEFGRRNGHSPFRIPHSAFTLVELLVVMGIIALVLATSLPALGNYTRQLRLKTATREVAGLLSLARSLSISSHRAHAVLSDSEQGTLTIIDTESGESLEHRVRLPSSVELAIETTGSLSGTPAAQIDFQPTGALAGRTVSLTLKDGERQNTITVVGMTGAITIQ